MNPTTISGPSEITTTDFLLPSNFSPLSTPLNISSARQGKKSKSVSEPSSKSPPGSSKVQHVPCKFFKNGACTAGKNCVFSHSKEIQPSDTVCKYYVKGNCKFGNKCALQHGNEKKPSSRNNIKPRSQTSQSSERVRQALEQRSLINFSEELDFLSRSFSRTNLEHGYPTSFGSSPNNLNYYTPQLKTSQLSNIFASPNQNNFSSSLPSQQPYPGPEDNFGPSANVFDTKSTSFNTSRFVSKNEFSSPNFNFGFSDEHDLLPSSLDELLTPTELQMRKTKVSMLSRPGFMNRSNTPDTLGLSPSTSRFLSNFDNGYFGTSLPSGFSLGITESGNNGDNSEPTVPANSLLTDTLNYEELFSRENILFGEERADSVFSEASDAKKGDDKTSDSHSLDDEVPFQMDGDF